MKIFLGLLLCTFNTYLLAGFSSVTPKGVANDVLIVLDDSGSMTTYRDKISKNLVSLIGKLDTEKLRLGLIMSDLDSRASDGSPFVGRSTTGDLSTILKGMEEDIKTLMKGVGTPEEVFYEPILNSFNKKAPMLEGFHRNNSVLNIYVFTDEDQENFNIGTFNFLKEMSSYKPIENIVFNLVYPAGDCSRAPIVDVKETELFKAVLLTGGKVHDLCDSQLKALEF